MWFFEAIFCFKTLLDMRKRVIVISFCRTSFYTQISVRVPFLTLIFCLAVFVLSEDNFNLEDCV